MKLGEITVFYAVHKTLRQIDYTLVETSEEDFLLDGDLVD